MSVYFIQEDIGPKGFIKIGYTRNDRSVDERLQTLQVGNGRPLVLRALLDSCGHETENWLHSRLRYYRLTGEWFGSGPPVVALMQWAGANRLAHHGEVKYFMESYFAALRGEELLVEAANSRKLSKREHAQRRIKQELDSGALTKKHLDAKIAQKENLCPLCKAAVEVGDEILEYRNYTEFVHADCVIGG